jgi:hypothetical protein
VVLEHILSGSVVAEAYKQAYHACKMSLSPSGESAYRQALSVGKKYGEAMHEFYKLAYANKEIERARDRVVSVHPDKMVVLTASSQYKTTREINWKIAKIKASNNELYVEATADQTLKQRVFSALKSLCWNQTLILKLKQ